MQTEDGKRIVFPSSRCLGSDLEAGTRPPLAGDTQNLSHAMAPQTEDKDKCDAVSDHLHNRNQATSRLHDQHDSFFYHRFQAKLFWSFVFLGLSCVALIVVAIMILF